METALVALVRNAHVSAMEEGHENEVRAVKFLPD
jgi:hypothetical protein